MHTCITAMMFFSCNALKCVSMNHQECKIRPVVMNINTNETLFCPHSILVMTYIIFMLNYVFLMLLKTWISEYLVKFQEPVKQDMYLAIKHVNVNADVNVKNWLTREYVMKHLFGILVNVNANVINHVFLDNTIYIMKVVNVEKKSLIN